MPRALSAAVMLSLLYAPAAGQLPMPVVSYEVSVASYNIRTASGWAVQEGGDGRARRQWERRQVVVVVSLALLYL